MTSGTAYWNSLADTFDDEPDHGLGDADVAAAWRRLLLDVLPPAPGRLVDLGCGTGSLSVLLAAEGYDVQGFDNASRMVERAVQKAARSGVGAQFSVGDAAAPDVRPSSVDVVLVRHVTWVLPDPAAALATWAGLVRPGGLVVLVEGSWSTGAGLTAAELTRLAQPVGGDVTVRQLPDPALWGHPIDDERYLLTFRRPV